ncbi:hypothetical protein KPH14_008449 [Odynerus spinipes]|uniref:Methylenetetrahydrofolate reductase (NAD(P)H) n=1 Tax=Odynerus spinipes TaxID=1348599 RepID=A0AAD9RE61_9HYME|nr:hypothetical protein KPH14_008449 [Odynerus spinipes]
MRHVIAGTEETFEDFANNSNCNDTITNDVRRDERLNEIIDLREVINNKNREKEIFYSFELFPMKKPNNIYERFFAEMDKYSPAFYALTWHTKSVTLDAVEKFPSNTLLHLAAKGLKRCNVEIILKRVHALGIRNIFALQGDSALEDGDFPHAIDLVKFIRAYFGETFCIFVAGYPDMHPLSPSKDLDLLYLKAKVDAGADFIITQIFFESSIFLSFVKDCNDIGIKVPIIPGIFPIPGYKCFERMTNICKVNVPKFILNRLDTMKDNDEAVRNFGIELTVNLIKDIIECDASYGFHLFTLNKISMVQNICNRLSTISRLHPEYSTALCAL